MNIKKYYLGFSLHFFFNLDLLGRDCIIVGDFALERRIGGGLVLHDLALVLVLVKLGGLATGAGYLVGVASLKLPDACFNFCTLLEADV